VVLFILIADVHLRSGKKVSGTRRHRGSLHLDRRRSFFTGAVLSVLVKRLVDANM
jgi:hypothetical protein